MKKTIVLMFISLFLVSCGSSEEKQEVENNNIIENKVHSGVIEKEIVIEKDFQTLEEKK
jgi:uncharacterized protein YcfL